MITPYGYGGAFFWGDRDAVARGFWPAFDAWAAERRWCPSSCAWRFSTNSSCRIRASASSGSSTSCAISRRTADELWMDCRAQGAQERQEGAPSRGITIELDAAGERLDDFLRLYEHTLERRDAPVRYRFPREFFERLPDARECTCTRLHDGRGRLVRARAALARNAYSFLGGTDSDAFELRPNDLLKWELILWAKQAGKRRLRPRRRLRRRRRDLPLQAQLRAARARAVLHRQPHPRAGALRRADRAGRRLERRRILSRVSGRDAVMRLLALPLAVLAFHTSVQPLSPHQRAVLTGPVWHKGCPVALSQLRLLNVTYWGFDGRAHDGNLVVNQRFAVPLSRVFRRLYELRFPIRHLSFADTYGRSTPADGDISGSVRVPAGRPVAVHGRNRHRHLVDARLRRGDRPEPGREPVRRLRHDARPRRPEVPQPLAPSPRDGHARRRSAPSGRSAGAGAAPGRARRRTTCTSRRPVTDSRLR